MLATTFQVTVSITQLIGLGHRDVESLFVGAQHPVFTWATQANQRVQLATTETRGWIDYGNVRFTIKGEDEVFVEINTRAPIEAWLQKRLHLLATFFRISAGSSRPLIDPGRRSQIGKGLARV